jgi:N-methylhydantoinase B
MTGSTTETEARSFDPALVEILNNEIGAISEEIALTISRSARSPMVRNGDFATALTDRAGGVVGQGYAAPQQLAQFMSLMRSLILKFEGDVHPDDVFLANDPYQGSGHMPDIAIVRPVFWREVLIGFSIAYSHQNDIGGRFPGGFSSQCRSSYEEGLRLPIVKYVDKGVRNEALLDLITANVRGPDVWIGDVEAKMAGCWRGARELEGVIARHGTEAFDTYCWYVNRSSEQAVRAAITEIPDGVYTVEDAFEDDGFATPGATVPIRVSLVVEGDHLTVDFTGTAGQVPSAINMGLSQTTACILGAMKVLVSPDVQMNRGFAAPITVEVPPGCLLNPRFPAAVGGRGPLASRVRVLTMLALAKALPGRIPVPSEGADSLHVVGKGAEPFVMLDGFFGGWGGRPDQDGIDGVAPMEFGSYGVTSGEMIEREYPVVLEGFEYVPDSAGPGRNRGSLSLRRSWRFLEPATAMIRTTRLDPSPGLAGGGTAGRSGNRLDRADGTVEERDDVMHWHVEMQPGDRLTHVIGGCGGYGDPFDRDPARVLADVVDGTLTEDGARTQYGVVVVQSGGTWTVDEAATAAARDRMGA